MHTQQCGRLVESSVQRLQDALHGVQTTVESTATEAYQRQDACAKSTGRCSMVT